jgi:hypothetical protein
MDIVDSIMMASACAAETSAFLRRNGSSKGEAVEGQQTEKEQLHA